MTPATSLNPSPRGEPGTSPGTNDSRSLAPLGPGQLRRPLPDPPEPVPEPDPPRPPGPPPPEPSRAEHTQSPRRAGPRHLEEIMEVLWIVVALAGYVVIMRWILPRLGVST